MSRKNKHAWVVNGNKDYRNRVFAIIGAYIIKSWDTDEYLRLSRGEIRKQTEATRKITSQRFIK